MKPKQIKKTTNTEKKQKMYYEPIRDKYIDPFTDFGFKKLFGEECNKDLLLDFLNELLYEEQGRIVSLTYSKSEKLGRTEYDRGAFFDLHCENEKGEKFIVEIQKSKQLFFKDRALFYSAFPIVEQANKGEWNYELKAVYTISILNFVFEEDKNDPHKYRYDVKLSDIETHKVFYDKLTFIYLEMPKFTKEVDELETRFDKWLYVIKNISRLEEIPDKLREHIFEKIFEAAEVAKLSKEEYALYSKNLKNIRDLKNSLDCAIIEAEAKGLAEGLTKGLTKGLAKGLTKGRAEGRAKGRAEGELLAIERVIIDAKRNGFSLEQIQKFTALTNEQVTDILKRHLLA